MKKTLLTILLCGWVLAQNAPAQAEPRVRRSEILSSMGNVDLNGFPRLSLDLGGAPELSKLGFYFRLMHKVRIGSDQSAHSEWIVSGLRTCVYLEPKGDLVWIKPNGQNVRYPRQDARLGKAGDGSSVGVFEAGVIEMTTPQGSLWRYKDGFLESIEDARLGTLSIASDRECILQISRRKNNTAGVIMRAEYSESGMLQRIVFPGGRTCRFEWDDAYRLLGVENTSGVRTRFEYNGALLARWSKSDGFSGAYSWKNRADAAQGIALGRAPVVLGADGFFRYEYARKGNASIVRVYTADGAFVSETSSGPGGLMQKTPDAIKREPRRVK